MPQNWETEDYRQLVHAVTQGAMANPGGSLQELLDAVNQRFSHVYPQLQSSKFLQAPRIAQNVYFPYDRAPIPLEAFPRASLMQDPDSRLLPRHSKSNTLSSLSAPSFPSSGPTPSTESLRTSKTSPPATVPPMSAKPVAPHYGADSPALFNENYATGDEAKPERTSESRKEMFRSQTEVGYLPVKSETSSNSSASATFSFEFPQRASEIILSNEVELKAYTKRSLPEGDCSFEGGYDTLPPGWWLLFKEQTALIGSTYSPFVML
jgi:hypothetical protein